MNIFFLWHRGLYRRDLGKELGMGTLDWIVPEEPSVITEVLIRGRQEAGKERRCYAAGCEDRGRGHKPKNAGDLQRLKKSGKQIVP